ncbi:MFS transporter [Pedobacter sp. HMWF019]|uniref:MFS transporter n=1 Tax=Pedobacter sp. HMWF019 TaxID=2056856 RepID=UPI000D33D656|nr:MFS transporter [Pedobacter sp. HMWF019]PTT01859.1 MFS transporter [Pedobacter sp. HMWF019]
MKKIAYACCLGVIGILTAEFAVIGILPQIASHYHISLDRAGILMSAFAFVVAIAGPFMSLLASGFDRKKVMIASLTLFLIASVVSSFSPPFWLLLAVRVLPAFLHSVYYAAAIAAVINVSKKKDQHKMMAIALSGVSIATVSTIPLATYLATISTWQVSFVLQSVICLLALVCVYRVMPAMPVKIKPTIGSQVGILKNPSVILSLLMILFMFAAEFSLYSYFAGYMAGAKKTTPTNISYFMFLFGITGLAGTWLAGKTLSRSVPATAIGFIVACNMVIPVLFYFTGVSILWMVPLVALWGIAYAPGFLIATSSVSSAAPGALEFSNGMAASFANLGITIGTLAGGAVISTYQIKNLPFTTIAFGVIAIGMVLFKSMVDRRKTLKIITKSIIS